MIKFKEKVSKKKLDSLTSVAAAHESQRPKLADERDEVFYTDLVATRQIEWPSCGKQSLTITLDGKMEEQSCPNDKTMAIKMKDGKSSLQASVV